MPLLALEHITKSFGPVRALRGVSLEVYPGEVHAIIGENGAGKSTLMKVLSGVHQPDSGTMTLDGSAFAPASPRQGRAAGISMIYQELTLAPHLSVADNITLGIEHARAGWLTSRRQEVIDALALLGQSDIDPDTVAGDLSIGKQQVVEIARALVAKARIVVMDEPTSSLSAADARALFEVVRRLRDAGVAVLYISHFLEEVVDIGDRYTVLRDGETVETGLLKGVTVDQLIPPMIGRDADELYPQSMRTFGDVLLRVDSVNGMDGLPASATFAVRRGEILGIAGLVGAGRSEMLRTLFGLRPGDSGTYQLANGTTISVVNHSSDAALRSGLNLLSENRKDEGLATSLSIGTNLTLSKLSRYNRHGFLDLQSERKQARHWVERLSIKCNTTSQPVETLSGGNQQKVCLARLLHDDSDVLLLDEPTRGIDIGSKAEMYQLIHEAASLGKGVIVASSYLPELFGICDTLAVMHRGRLSDVRPTREWTDEQVLKFATSGRPAA